MPWAAGLGLLVSFTATAGTDAIIGASRFPVRTAQPPLSLAQNAPLRATLKSHAAIFPVSRRDALTDARPRPASTVITSPETDGPEFAVESTGSIELDDPGSDGNGAGSATVSYDPAEGATPPIPRAVALSSVTPAPADAVPIEVAASSLAVPGFSPRLDREPARTPSESIVQNRYAELIQPEAMDREQRCLAEAVYFEARSEPEDGMAAVAQVVLNRVKSGLYPANVCGVVYQNRHRYMGCQFSFACEGKSLRITDEASWRTATRIAGAVIEGKTYLSEVGGATHYHADYVRPRWSRRLKKNDVIGRHIFYQLKPGQT